MANALEINNEPEEPIVDLIEDEEGIKDVPPADQPLAHMSKNPDEDEA